MLHHGIFTADTEEEFAEAMGELRRAAVLLGGAAGRTLERMADQLEGLDVRPVASAPSPTDLTTFVRGAS